jgi:hypothetical protein
MVSMPPQLEAEAAHIHIAGGASRLTPPPGCTAQVAPRRAARGRAEDVLFLCVGLEAPQPLSPGLPDHLARLASEAYFGTAGSVTAALREAASDVNKFLLQVGQEEEEPFVLQGRLLAGVLRGTDLYLAQCGEGQCILIRSGQVQQYFSEEVADRPLGATFMPQVWYHHIEVQPGDLLILSTWPPPLWSDATLSGLAGLDPAKAADRLTAASDHDLAALVIRLIPATEAKAPALRGAIPARPSSTPPSPRPRQRIAERPAAEETDFPPLEPPSPISTPRTPIPPVGIKGTLTAFLGRMAKVLARLAPRLVPGRREGGLPTGLMMATAIAVPIIVVAITSVIYFRRGLPGQYQEYLDLAQQAIAAAESNPESALARQDWVEALNWLDLAARQDETAALRAMREKAQAALDEIDLVIRLDFQPAVSGGFGSNARITAIAATASDLYVLDGDRMTLWHAWATGRTYEVDGDFDCLRGPDSMPGMGLPIAIAAQPAPGALGAEGVVALDADGTLLYCAPGESPALSQLTPPDIGWGRIQAIDVLQDSLYVLDPGKNAVWIYDASGGLFTGAPALYFAGELVPDMAEAVDLALAQDELLILYSDGHLDRCHRTTEAPLAGGVHILVDCDQDLRFVDERPGGQSTVNLPASIPTQIVFSPPPEPSIFFLDAEDGSVFQYSLRMVYQGQYLPSEPFDAIPTTFAIGPLNELFLAAGNQVYYTELLR